MNVALDNFCEGTRVGGIELLLDPSLKQNVMEKLHFGFWGVFFLCLVLRLCFGTEVSKCSVLLERAFGAFIPSTPEDKPVLFNL